METLWLPIRIMKYNVPSQVSSSRLIYIMMLKIGRVGISVNINESRRKARHKNDEGRGKHNVRM